MMPLFSDAFFIAMAVTIVFGLLVATVLTMIVVPTLYAIFFKAKETRRGNAEHDAGARRIAQCSFCLLRAL